MEKIGFYLVWVPTSQYPPKVRHSIYADAANEARRIAEKTGERAYVVLATHVYDRVKVEERSLEPPLPF